VRQQVVPPDQDGGDAHPAAHDSDLRPRHRAC
jgi:hypothetical protein